MNLSESPQTESSSDIALIEESSKGTSPISSKVYDAIQMDFMMPNIEGPAAIEIIREMGYTSPVIGISGTSYLYDLKIHKYSF